MRIQVIWWNVSWTRRGRVDGLTVIRLDRRLVAEQGLGEGQVQAGEVHDRVDVLEGRRVEPGLEIAQVEGPGQDVDAARIPAAFFEGAQPFVRVILADTRQQPDVAVPDSQPGGSIQASCPPARQSRDGQRGQQVIAAQTTGDDECGFHGFRRQDRLAAFGLAWS